MIQSVFFVKVTNDPVGTLSSEIIDSYPLLESKFLKTSQIQELSEKIRIAMEETESNIFFEVDGVDPDKGMIAGGGIIPPNFPSEPTQFHYIGFHFDKGDNPLDYQPVFEEKLLTLFIGAPIFENISNPDNYVLLPTFYLSFRRQANEMLSTARKKTQRERSWIRKIFVFGLDAAGKSTFSNWLLGREFEDKILPTKRRAIINLTLNGMPVRVWDMPGQEVLRKSWRRGMEASDMLVYIIDLADPERFELAKMELWNVLNRYEVEGVPLVFLANKSDLLPSEDAFTADMIITAFELDKIVNREWALFFTSMKTERGLPDVVDWVTRKLRIDGLEC